MGMLSMVICEYLIAIIDATISVENKAGQNVFIAFICTVCVVSPFSHALTECPSDFTVFRPFVSTDIAFFATTWGPHCMGRDRRDFPFADPRKKDRIRLALELCYRIRMLRPTSSMNPPEVQRVSKAANLGAKVFFIWSSTCVGCWIFAYFYIPETKGIYCIIILLRGRAVLMEHSKDVKEGGVDVEGLCGAYMGSESAGADAAGGDEKKAAVTHSETV